MSFSVLPLGSPLALYDEQAVALLADPKGEEIFRRKLPRLLRTDYPWVPREDVEGPLTFDLDDARLAVARGYDFASWEALVSFVNDESVLPFERCVEAVVDG
ncbi:MAG: hypothetical protein EXQ52_14870, partial [Bryobacterales bacterium]|nr:hypothetical protein [Bryobacterales bacterium]